jgi:thiol:disulfide interchange protein DsbD
MDLQEQNLNTPIGYTPDVDKYKNWLNDGLDNFK